MDIIEKFNNDKTLNQEIDKIKTEIQNYLPENENNETFFYNEFLIILFKLFEKRLITLEDLNYIKEEYLKQNHFEFLFNLSQKNFGLWGEKYLIEQFKSLQKLDYSNAELFNIKPESCDLIFPIPKNKQSKFSSDVIKIEVKTARARKDGNPIKFGEEKCNLIFQSIKPNYFDIIILCGVWKNKIKFWIFGYDEILKKQNKQHRNTEIGQLHITSSNMEQFEEFSVSKNNILGKIKEKFGLI